MWHADPELSITDTWKGGEEGRSVAFIRELRISLGLPENMLATAAIIKLKITPGPAIFLATMPATKYIPVPQQEPTPSDVKSSVVKHF